MLPRVSKNMLFAKNIALKISSIWTFDVKTYHYITIKMVQCNLCEEEYSEIHIELHLVGVHGVDGPKEMYSSSEMTSNENMSQTAIEKPNKLSVSTI